MKKQGFVYCVVIVSMALTLLFSGCLSIPDTPVPRFYMLEGINEDQAVQKFDLTPNIIIGIGPVGIPEYQDRPQIVTQNKDKMLTFAQFDRWGEALDLALARVISEDLTLMLPKATVKPFPWSIAIPVKYQVIIDIIQLESQLNKDLLFVAQWTVLDLEKKEMVLIKRTEFRQAIEPHNYSGLAKTLSAACVSLSSQIAESIASLPTQNETK